LVAFDELTNYLHRSFLNLTVKKFWKLVQFCRSYQKIKVAYF